ncbi:MAG: hypothetical protein GXO83_01040 [Chlorobi bacterium]|nr:hypothetical protein [Chlorobiota bacterium]
MKRVLYIFLSLVILSSCGGSKKQLQKGNYDIAINKAVKKLMRNPDSSDDIMVLERSYKLANEQDLEQIKFLKMEGKPDNWDAILNHYMNLKNRQTKVRPVLPLKLGNRTVNFDYVDYDSEIIQAKHKAAEYFFAHGQKLMNNGDKDSYRQAYYEFSKVKDYWGDYENIDKLLSLSRYYGMSRVIVAIENNTQLKLSPQFQDELLAIDPANLNTEWVEYYTRHLDDSVNYDYQVNISLNVIAVSPDMVSEKDTIEKKRIENGFEYALDQNGNVMKDTAGNDIKIKKYKDITCSLVKTIQQKDVTIQGNVEIYSLSPMKLLKKDPIGANSHFEHFSARAIGDVDALSAESRQMINAKKVPFPSDVEMIMRCSENLKQAIRGILMQNRRFIY